MFFKKKNIHLRAPENTIYSPVFTALQQKCSVLVCAKVDAFLYLPHLEGDMKTLIFLLLENLVKVNFV